MKLKVSRADTIRSVVLILIGLLVPFSVLSVVLAADHKVYYVSADGTGNGSSTDTPMNITAAKRLSLQCGDRVLFKRGDIFYDTLDFVGANKCTTANEYVYFSDYGDQSADYPIFTTANVVSDSSAFSKLDGYDDIWVMDFTDKSKWSGYASYSGNVAFFRSDAGGLFGKKIQSLELLAAEDEYSFCSSGQLLYIKSSQNPVSKLGTLYIANGGVMGGSGNPAVVKLTSYSDFSHLWIRDGGSHGANQSANKSYYINFHDNIISEIGGAYQASRAGTRLGNAVEFYQNSGGVTNNVSVTNNIIRNVYDTGFTIQGNTAASSSNVLVAQNVFTNVSMNIELWGGGETGVYVRNNYIWNAGAGWGGYVRSNPEVSSAWYFGSFASGANLGITLEGNKVFNPARVAFVKDSKVFTGGGFSGTITSNNNTFYLGDNSAYCLNGTFNNYLNALSYCSGSIRGTLGAEADSEFIISDSVINHYLHNYSMENSNNIVDIKRYLDKASSPIINVEIEKLPNKLSYTKDKESLDLAGGKLLVTYIDYSQKMVDMSEAAASGFSNTSTGKKTVTLTYAGANLTFDVNVVSSGKVVNSISVKKAPTKTTFVQNTGTLDLSGGELTVNYADGTSRTLAMTSPDVSVSGYNNTSTGTKNLTLSYMGKTATTSVSVVAKAIDHIEMAAPSYRLILSSANKSPQPRYGLIRVVYNDGSEEYVNADGSGVSWTPAQIATGTLGVQTITLTYAGHTTTFDVYNSGKQISSVSIGNLPKTTYTQFDDELNLAGGTFAVKYSDGTSGVLPMDIVGVKAFGFDNTNVGYDAVKFFIYSIKPGDWQIFQQPLGIKYTKNTTPRIQTISMKTLPKTDYAIGDSRNLSGGVLKATYSNGTTKDVSLTGSGVTVDALDTSTEGVKYLTVSYDGKMTTYPVTVSSATPPAPVMYTLTVKHLAKDGAVLAPQTTEELESGSNYSVSPDNELLKLYNVTSSAPTSGKITSDLTIVFTYERKIATVNVRHVDEAGAEVAPTESFTVDFGNRYTAKDKASALPNYTLIRRSENYTGVAMSTPIDVTFTYRRKATDLNAQVSITSDGSTIGNDSQKVGYEIIFEAESSNYTGEATISIVDELPYALDESASSLDGGAYDAEAGTLTWTIDAVATESPQAYNVRKQIELQFADVPHTDRVAVSQVQASIALGSEKTALASAAVENEVAFTGEIEVRYMIAGTNTELANGLVLRGLIGNSVVVVVQRFEGYELVHDVSGRYQFADEVRQLTFEYKKIEEPDEPGTPGDPNEPGTPDEPDTPDTPDNPDTPDTPDNPDTPDVPDTPDTPDTPDAPDTPDTPDTPDNPDTPDVPDTPDTPDNPDTPDAPDTPGEPENPDVPGGTDKPENPGEEKPTPGQPGGNSQSGTSQGDKNEADGPFKPNTGAFTSSIRSSLVSDILVPVLVVTIFSSITGIIVLVGRERRQDAEDVSR